MKQTAVEWLQEALEQTILTHEQEMQTIGLFEQAKAMEKEQIVNSFEIGYENGACVNEKNLFYHGSNYYNETFKSE